MPLPTPFAHAAAFPVLFNPHLQGVVLQHRSHCTDEVTEVQKETGLAHSLTTKKRQS